MRLIIENKSGYLNDYYFQTLCLLYYPGETFPKNDSGEINSAFFYLDKKENENGIHWLAKVKLSAGEKSSEAFFTTENYKLVIECGDEFFATLALGKAFLQAGRELFGFSLPWGYITGLRPVKRAKNYLEKGYDDKTVKRMFTDDYEVAGNKAELAISTARLEMKMLEKIGHNVCGLYISIPFCPTRCEYCSFVSYSNAKLFKLIPDYIEKLKLDLLRTSKIIKELDFTLGTIYIGGGTPSILNCEQLDGLLGEIEKDFDLSGLLEYSFEAGRPDTISVDNLRIIKSHGVGRISINPQTTNDDVLKRIGRCHSVSEFLAATESARKIGFDCINTDLIAGLPGDTEEGFEKSLTDVISLGFENITVHSLSIKNASELRFDPDKLYDPEGETAKRCVAYAYDKLKISGYNSYYLYRQKNTVGNAENTGYAKKGYENLYNVIMMEEYSTVFACGAGSITKIVSPDRNHIERIAFPKYPFEYLSSKSDIGEEKIRKFYSKI